MVFLLSGPITHRFFPGSYLTLLISLELFSILMVVRSRFLFLRYRINSLVLSLFPNPTGGSINTFSSLRYISFNPSGVPPQFGGVSPCHSRILKTEEEFLLNPYLFFQRGVVQAWWHPLIIVFDYENSFLTIRSISWVVSISFLRMPPCHNSAFSACSYRSPNLTGGSFKYTL